MTMTKTELRGIFPAFPTPYDENGALALDRLPALLEKLIDAGVAGFVPAGGTGEYTAMTVKERIATLEKTVEIVAGRVPVIGGVLTPGFGEAVDMGRDFLAAGADAIMLIAPFYVHPNQAGIEGYYRAYRDTVDTALILYDVPARTKVSVAPDTIGRLAADGTIIGMKASNTDMNHFGRVTEAVGNNASILSGDESTYVLQMALGAVGGILASAVISPRQWNEITALVQSGEMDKAIAAHRDLTVICDALFCETNPGPLKEAMRLLGLDFGDVRLPLQKASDPTIARLKSLIEARYASFF